MSTVGRPLATLSEDGLQLTINIPEIAGRAAQRVCSRCFSGDDPDLIFAACLVPRRGQRACGNCAFRHHAHLCDLNANHHDSSAIGGVMLPTSVTTQRSSGAKLGTRASVRDHEDDQLTASLPPPTRAPKRRRLMITLRLPQPSPTRDPPGNGGDAEEPSGRDATPLGELSLFLSQDEDGPVPEQSDNFDGFDSDIDAGRLSESPEIVPTIEGTETAGTPHASSPANRSWAPTSRRIIISDGEEDPFAWYMTPGRRRRDRTYATQDRTIARTESLEEETGEEEEDGEDGEGEEEEEE